MNTKQLDAPLLRIAKDDYVCMSDLTCSILVAGVSGSGKTSGAGAAIRRALLRCGTSTGSPAGGCVLVAKPEEVALWQKEARENGREDSLIVFGPDGKHGLNIADMCLARDGFDGTPSLVDFIMCAADAGRAAHVSDGDNKFFDGAMRQALGMAIPVLYSAWGTVQFDSVARFVQSSPTSLEELGDPEYQEKSYWFITMALARKSPVIPMPADEFNRIGRYYKDDWCRLDPKTRSNCSMSLSVALDKLTSGPLKRAFGEKTTFSLEMIWHGAIIIVAWPTLTMRETGVIANKIVKLAFQRTMPARQNLSNEHRRALSFCYADECQEFLLPSDASFLAISRGFNVCNVYLTQSLPGLINSIGGPRPKEAAEMLCSNFATKIFHTLDVETAKWASEICGKGIQLRNSYSDGVTTGRNYGTNMGDNESSGSSSGMGISTDHQGNQGHSINFGTNSSSGTSRGVNRGWSEGESYTATQAEQIDYDLQPSFFMRHLKTGGPANGNEVTAIWHQAGRTFRATGTNYLHVTFKQGS